MSTTKMEKSFKKPFPITASKTVLGNAAKRFLKEFEQVWGYMTDDAEEFAAAIRSGEEFGYSEDDYDSGEQRSNTANIGVYTFRVKVEYYFYAEYDTDDYGDPCYLVSWYLYTVTVYTKYLKGTGIKISFTDYTRLVKWTYRERGKYRYFCTHRPPSAGCIPDGFTNYEVYLSGSRYIGEVTYNEKPDEEEAKNFGLIFDEGWESERAAAMAMEDEVEN